MKTAVDKEGFEKACAAFYSISGIRMAFFDIDYNEVCSYPHKLDPFCELLRKNHEFDVRCQNCDKEHLKLVEASSSPLTYRCHAGLYEMVVPIKQQGHTVGYLLLSHILRYQSVEEAWKVIEPLVKPYGADMEELKRRLSQKRLFEDSYLDSSQYLLLAAASFLVEKNYAYLRYDSIANEIDSYLDTHLKEDLRIKEIASHFHLSRTTVYEVMDELYPEGLAKAIRKKRLSQAKRLLDLGYSNPISELCEEVGFSDPSYFIVLFREEYGVSPNRYRKGIKEGKTAQNAN